MQKSMGESETIEVATGRRDDMEDSYTMKRKDVVNMRRIRYVDSLIKYC